MEREDIPEENAGINVLQHVPYHRGSPFRHRAAFRRALFGKLKIPSSGMLTDMNVVSQRQSCTTPSTVSEVPPDPDCVHWLLHRTPHHGGKCGCAATRRVTPVMHFATIRIGIETVFKLQRGHCLNKRMDLHSFGSNGR